MTNHNEMSQFRTIQNKLSAKNDLKQYELKHLYTHITRAHESIQINTNVFKSISSNFREFDRKGESCQCANVGKKEGCALSLFFYLNKALAPNTHFYSINIGTRTNGNDTLTENSTKQKKYPI